MSSVHSAVGSYVADALSPVERAEFEAHLPACNACRLEVAEFAETVAELTTLVATPAPAALRVSVLAAVNADRQSAPELAARSERRASLAAEPASTAQRHSQAAAVTELRPLAPEEVAPLEKHPSVVPHWSWLDVAATLSDDLAARRARLTVRVFTALIAAVLVVALALGGWVYVLSQRNQTQLSEAQQATELLSAPDVKLYTSTVNGAPVSYVVSKQRNQAMFTASSLADPGGDRTYQLWTLKGQVATPAGLVRTGGVVREWIRGPVGDSDGLAISNEPAPNGSLTPTLPPLSAVAI